VPRIRDEFLDCVVYLYPSHNDADEGKGIGGTGFIIVVRTKDLKKNFLFPYIVTNRHVVEAGNTVVRMTTQDGKKQIIETDERDWQFHPAGDDLAALLISLNPQELRFSHIFDKDLLSKDDSSRLHVGIGDDVFVVGRFVNHEGKQKNSPTARFGCIAQMPNESVRLGQFNQECYLVEARSVAGFSGSPVFWHVRPFGGGSYRPNTSAQIGPLLLGVEAGYVQDWTPVCNSNGDPINFSGPDGMKVKVNSGMMVVVPAWKLAELLIGKALTAQRKEIEDRVRRENDEDGS
jgi:hypothetical protein